jgi:C-terminal processing protease CtpA/Prc
MYFDIGRLFNFPEFDVIGLILRPEDDGRFTIVGTAEYEGKPSVPGVQPGDHFIAVDGIPVLGNTLGQVWLMLGGEAGKERQLTIERNGKQIVVVATVRHFLAEVVENDLSKKKSH